MERFRSELRAPQSGEKREVIYPESAKSVWTRVKDVYHGDAANTAFQLFTNPILNLSDPGFWGGEPLKYGVRLDQVHTSWENAAQTALAAIPAFKGAHGLFQPFKAAFQSSRKLKNVAPAVASIAPRVKGIVTRWGVKYGSRAKARLARIAKQNYRDQAAFMNAERAAHPFAHRVVDPGTYATPLRWLGKSLFGYAGPNFAANPLGYLAYNGALTAAEILIVRKSADAFANARDRNMRAEAEKAAPVGGPPPVVPPVETNAPPVKAAAPMDVVIADSVVRQAHAESGGDTNKFAEAVAKIPEEVLDGVRSNRYAGFFRKRNGIPLSLAQKTLDNTTDEKKRADLIRMLQESEAAFGALDSNAQLIGGN